MTQTPAPVVALKAVAILAIGLYLLHLFTAGVDEQVTDHRPAEERSAPTKAERLAADEDRCWSGDDEPLAEIPGHVVWRHEDGRTVYSKALTGPALDTLYADGDLPGRPIAFCL